MPRRAARWRSWKAHGKAASGWQGRAGRAGRNRALEMPTIKELQAAGCESLRAIAAGLEERGIPTARGGKWSSVQVARLLEAPALSSQASPPHETQGWRTKRLGVHGKILEWETSLLTRNKHQCVCTRFTYERQQLASLGYSFSRIAAV
jgi:Recombinase